MPKVSLIRQNYSEECEAAINKLINMELHASYVYLSMAFHFDRDDIALKGFHEYFKKKSDTQRKHAEMLMSYQNKRGGNIVLLDVKAPKLDWNSHTIALEDAIALEKSLVDGLLALYKVGTEKHDPHLCHHFNRTLIKEGVDTVSELGKLVTNAKRCGNDLGLYMFDRKSMS